MKQNHWRSAWTTTIIFIDAETGEILPKNEVKQYYIITKTLRNAEKSKFGTGGIITYTNLCRRSQQQKLF